VRLYNGSPYKYSEADIDCMLQCLVENIFIVIGDKVFQLSVGIPMDSNCAPLLAILVLRQMRDSQLHCMTKVMILTLLSSTFLFYVVYHSRQLMSRYPSVESMRKCMLCLWKKIPKRGQLLPKNLMVQNYNESCLKLKFSSVHPNACQGRCYGPHVHL
jgi:hypothetical protein